MEKTITFRLPTQLHKKLQIIAATSQRSMSGQLRWMIENTALDIDIHERSIDSKSIFLDDLRNEQN